MAALRVLTFTTLYPNAEKPNHGVFVENRLRQTLARHDVSATVLAPVPYFPFTSEIFGAYARFARVPATEERHGMQVHHPRYALIPKIGMNVAPRLLYRGRAVRRADAWVSTNRRSMSSMRTTFIPMASQRRCWRAIWRSHSL